MQKKTYYNCFIDNVTGKRRNLLWKTLNNMLNFNHTRQINVLAMNGTTNSREELANAFNSYFVNLVGNNSHLNIPKARHHMQTIAPESIFMLP